MLQRAHGADPAAEEAAQKERRQQDNQAPEQAAIEGVTGQRIDQRDQRIPLEEEAHRGEQVNIARSAGNRAQRGKDQQRKKQEQKEYLRDPAPQRQSGTGHEYPPCAARGRSPYMNNDSRSDGHRTVICITVSRVGAAGCGGRLSNRLRRSVIRMGFSPNSGFPRSRFWDLGGS